MEIRSPAWTLKATCPICEQGSCLTFVACPSCNSLAVRCSEDGCVFPNPRDLSVPPPVEPVSCPGCGQNTVESFPPATDVLIRSKGFSKDEYE